MTVDVVQYMRPDGRAVLQSTEIGDSYKEAYRSMRAKGWNLAAEVLMTGDISLTIEDRQEEEDVAIEVVRNGPDVQAAIERLLSIPVLAGGSQ